MACFHGMNPISSMKTAIISIITATLLGAAFYASGRLFDAASLASLVFATGLVAWTISQYDRAPRLLRATRPVRLPVRMPARRPSPAALRPAA
jgi:hypothetical protein